MNSEKNWEVIEHSWSDTSIVNGDKTICFISIYDEATKETQEALEQEALSNSKLISAAPDLLEALQDLVRFCIDNEVGAELDLANHAINKALGL